MPARRPPRPETRPLLPPAPRAVAGALVFTPPMRRVVLDGSQAAIAARAAAHHRVLVDLLRTVGTRLFAEADALDGGTLPTEHAAMGESRLGPVAERLDRVRAELAMARALVGVERILGAVQAAADAAARSEMAQAGVTPAPQVSRPQAESPTYVGAVTELPPLPDGARDY